jgi:hypothetical protein
LPRGRVGRKGWHNNKCTYGKGRRGTVISFDSFTVCIVMCIVNVFTTIPTSIFLNMYMHQPIHIPHPPTLVSIIIQSQRKTCLTFQSTNIYLPYRSLFSPTYIPVPLNLPSHLLISYLSLNLPTTSMSHVPSTYPKHTPTEISAPASRRCQTSVSHRRTTQTQLMKKHQVRGESVPCARRHS